MNGVTLYGFGFGKSGRALEVALVEEGGALLALERQDGNRGLAFGFRVQGPG